MNIQLYRDGDKWGALVGPNILEGFCGFGTSLLEAMQELVIDIQNYPDKWGDLVIQGYINPQL